MSKEIKDVMEDVKNLVEDILEKTSDGKTPLHSENEMPDKLHIVPIGGRPIFPGIFTPMMINNKEDIQAIEKATEESSYIGIVMLEKDVDNPGFDDLYKIGTVAKIIKKINLPDGGLNVFVSTQERFKMVKLLNKSGPMQAAVEYLKGQEKDSFEIKALTRALVSEMKEISESNPLFSDELRANMLNVANPGRVADFVASILNIDKEEQQKILETLDVGERIKMVLVHIKREQEILKVQRKVQHELNDRVEKSQKSYFLREEMKAIQEELGMDNESRTKDVDYFEKKIAAFNFQGEIKETVDSELEKFALLDPHDPEYASTRAYLDLVASLPWIDIPVEDFNLDEASKILEADHYGMEDVKKRIIEHLAVRKLKHDGKGSVLILVGPPGVGKTSIGKSVAKAMHKKFYRFSVGGEHDESKIKGFRRTYIGAMPGQILSGLKITKSSSPVFMIDEVDKMNASHQGDPSAALLEVLDPEQNSNFRDTYLDLPFDLSNVFFILTANTLDTIPKPLLDRAEIIELSGYVDSEKIQIAKKYLLPKTLEKNGLKKSQVKFTKDAFELIATEYAREAGVRNYEKCVDKIIRKMVRGLVEEYEKENPSPKYPTLEDIKKKDKSDKKTEKTVENDSTDNPSDKSKKNVETVLQEEDFVKLLLTEAEKISQDEAKKIAAAISKKTFTVDVDEVRTYLGKAVFDESQIKTASIPGTAIGLAWTSMGGDTLLLESIAFESSKGGLQLTGQMGDVMKESAQIAMNWIKQYAIKNKIKDGEWFEKNTIHLHIPEGATPKDGPSAGITMVTTFNSLLTGKKIKPNLAMTGELSLTGRVLPIGGLREKTVAAKRNKIKTIIIPKTNLRDLDDIPDQVKSGIKFIPVSHVEEVLEWAF